DGDGLLDGEELFHPDSLFPYENNSNFSGNTNWSGGWEIVYGQAGDGTNLRTLVTADPLGVDNDGDFINDAKERIYGYNPNVAEELNILGLDSHVSADIVAANGSLGYTATVKNELDNRILNGLLQAEFPVDSVQSTAVLDTLFPQEAVTVTGSVVAPNISASTTTSLTLRAGANIEDPDTGRTLWLHLNESSGATTFQDDAQLISGAHNATCTGAECPTASDDVLDFDGNDQLVVSPYDEIEDPDRFTISVWVRPENDEYLLFLKGLKGFALGSTQGNLVGQILLSDCSTPINVFAPVLRDHEWHNVILTFDETTLTLYVNGVQVDSAPATSYCRARNSNLLLGPNLQGKMDEVEIYPTALTSDEIAVLFRKPVIYLTDYLSVFGLGQSQHSQAAFTCETVLSCPTITTGVSNEGFSFNQTQFFKQTSQGTGLSLGENNNNFTMSMWLYPENNYTPDNNHFNQFGQMIMGNHEAGYEKAPPSLYIKGKELIVRFGHADGQGYCSATSSNILTYNSWQHITVTFNGTAFNVYRDGTLVDTFSGTDCTGQGIYDETVFYIGHSRSPSAYFTQIDSFSGTKKGEGFIWSDSNIYNNGFNDLALVWNSAKNVFKSSATITVNAWATTLDDTIGWEFCDRDNPEDGIPAMCELSDDNWPLLTQKHWDDAVGNGGNPYALDTNTYESMPVIPGQKSLLYDGQLNPYEATLRYNLYTDGFQGKMDEIGLYSVALNADEVDQLFEGSIRGLELSFDEPPGQDIFTDATSNGFDGVCSGGSCPDSGIPGRSNQAVRFDGASDYLTLEDTLTLGMYDNSFTFMAWVKGDAFNGDRAILGTDGSNGDRKDLLLGVRNGKPYMSFGGNGNDIIDTTTLQPDSWYHLAFRYNSNGKHQAIFINGVRTAYSGGGVRSSFIGLDAVRMGSALGGNYFDGLIDDLVLVRKSLTPSEIQAVMNESPILNLHLDEDFNTSAFVDDTPAANNATCSGATCPAAGAKGQMREAPIFDGTQILTIPNATEIDA
ncbi:MAG: hypothetical protein GY943_08935, partial [Chloroflexi bacterium]|nr:hypothetical protein [Chloroflexota bacterium]